MKDERFQKKIKEIRGLHSSGQVALAAAGFDRLLDRAPARPALLNDVGMLALRLGYLPQGLAWLSRSLAAEPAQSFIWAVRGVGLAHLGRPQEALEHLTRAIELEPGNADALLDRGRLHHALGMRDAALRDFDAVVRLDERSAAALTNRGAVLHELGRREAALADFDAAIALDARSAPALANRGALLHELGRAAEAMESCRLAVESAPNYAPGHFNLGVVLEDLGNRNEALRSYGQALALEPQHAGANLNAGHLNLKLGNFEPGWRGYEWRWRNGRLKAEGWRRESPKLWLGDRPVAGRTLLLYGEQGLGDTLQFCRYAPLLAERGARVILEVDRSLQGLLRNLAGVADVLAQGDTLPEHDLLCPLASLPLAFGTTLANIPAQVPYLHADGAKVSAWKARLGPSDRLRIALVWRSGFRPDQPETWAVNGLRDVPLPLLAPLARSDVEFHSLQKGQAAEAEWAQLRARSWGGPELVDHSASLLDFSDTAALVQALDLLISVDTSTAHLGGALGKPVWLLVRHDACWRWLLERSESPWYPTLRLYRQSLPGDWTGVVERVAADLAALARAPSSPLRCSA